MDEDNNDLKQPGLDGQQTNNDEPGNEEEKVPTVEELATELAKERAEKEKNKTALDKALKDNGTLTKQLRERMTAQEQEEEAKRTREEEGKKYVESLERKVALTDAKTRYLDMGMDAKLAGETAEAELDGDREAVTSNLKKFMELSIKEERAAWLKERPDPHSGNDEEDEEKDSFLEGFKQ